MMEVWKKIFIDEIKTDYSVSNLGNVRNDITGKILSQRIQQGYKHVTLAINKKPKSCRVHRLVAAAFIENPDNKPFVNHIDCNRSNNIVKNLEWVTPSENSQKAAAMGRFLHSSRLRAVTQYDLNGNKLRTFESASEAARQFNLQPSKITECCKGRRRRTGDYQWRYADEEYKCLPQILKEDRPGTKVARCDDDLNILQIYESYRAAAEDINGTYQAIASICSGKTVNIHHKGWRWKKVDDIVQ
jgi:uncharacterized HNH endonuclease L247